MLDKINEEEQSQKSEIPSYQINLIKSKLAKMNIIQLKKQRMKSIQDLKEIHSLLNQLIQQKNMETLSMNKNNLKTTIEYDKQLKLTNRKKQNLERSLQNFEFMLSSQYDERLDEQIAQNRNYIKGIKYQLNLLRRQMEIPMQKQQRFCQKLQKQILTLQNQIQVITKKNRVKKIRFIELVQQNEDKVKLMHHLDNKRIQKMEQQQEIQQLQYKNNQNIRYNQLHNTKNKLIKLINSINKNQSVSYNCKRKQKKQLCLLQKQIDQSIQQIQSKIYETTHNIQYNRQQLKQAKIKKKNHKNNPTKKYGRVRYLTQAQESYQTSKKQELYSKNYQSRHSGMLHNQPYHMNQQQLKYDSKLKSRYRTHKFPSIHQFIGKNRLIVQDQCDLSQIVYKGEGD